MAYHNNQPFNQNMLRPCPMLENPEALRGMVKATGATSTDYQSPESVDHLCDKTTPYAKTGLKLLTNFGLVVPTAPGAAKRG